MHSSTFRMLFFTMVRIIVVTFHVLLFTKTAATSVIFANKNKKNEMNSILCTRI